MRPDRLHSAALPILFALLLAPGVASAQAPPPDRSPAGIGAEASPALQRHHGMEALMDDMARQLAAMRDRMAKGDLTPRAEREMAAQMKELARLMRRMSGLLDRPTMNTAERAKQLRDIRAALDAMSWAHRAPAGAKEE